MFVVLLFAQATFAESSVRRTIEGDNFTYVGDTTKNITINLTGSPEGNFSFWGAVETLPENMNVVLLTANSNVIKVDSVNWSFASINGNVLRYNLTSNATPIDGVYIIPGWAVDSENMNILTIPDTHDTYIRIAPAHGVDIVFIYNTNGVPGIQKDEVVNAVWDYFYGIIPSLTEVLKVVRAYLGL